MGRIRGPLSASVLLAVGACVFGACSSGPSTPTSPTSTTRAPTSTTGSSSTTSSTTTTAAAPLTTCQETDLRISLVGAQGAAGTQELTFALTNTGTACATYGYPGLLLASSSGAPLPTVVERGGELSFESVAPGVVHLGAGQTAYFNAGYTDISSGTAPCEQPAEVQVIPPTNTSHASVPAPAGMLVCDGGTLHVSAVFASNDAAATQTTAS